MVIVMEDEVKGGCWWQCHAIGEGRGGWRVGPEEISHVIQGQSRNLKSRDGSRPGR